MDWPIQVAVAERVPISKWSSSGGWCSPDPIKSKLLITIHRLINSFRNSGINQELIGHLFRQRLAVALPVAAAHQCGIGISAGSRRRAGFARHSGSIQFLDEEARRRRQRKFGHHRRLPLDGAHGKVGIEGVAFKRRPFRPQAAAGSL